MIPEPTYEIKTAEDLEKFLLGLLRDIRKKQVDLDTARALSLIADKINKNGVNQIVYKNLTGHKIPIPFYEPKEDMTKMLNQP